MEASETEASESSANREGQRENDPVRRFGGLTVKQTMRAFVGAESASFFLAALIHAGILVHGYEHREAMIAESAIGTVLLVGLAMTWFRPRSISAVAVSVQAFALAGTFVGIWTIIVGIGPRTVPDIVYHAVIVVVLTIGLVSAWRSRGTGAT